MEILNRRIVIPASAFDSKVKFLEKTRKSFGGGTFNINEGALLERYYLFLKEEYSEGMARQYFAAECIGLQHSKNDYWCLSGEVCVIREQYLQCVYVVPDNFLTLQSPWRLTGNSIGWVSCHLNFGHIVPLTFEAQRGNSPPPHCVG